MRVVQMSAHSKPPNYSSVTPPHTPPSSQTEKLHLINFKNFKSDDWIILAIIFALIFEGSDDYILICALGYLFLMGL